jgi:raffinose/stachyose/melibiose transport system permease protein
MKERPTRGLFAWIAMGIVVLFWIGGPLWTIVVNSFKTERDAALLDLSLPTEWAVVENYATVIKEGRLASGLLNSLLYSGASILLILLAGSLAAWVLARSRSKWSQPLYYLAISGVFVPPAIVTTILVMKLLGVYGERISIILFYAAIYLPVSVFLLAGFVRGIPYEIEEAARVDGVGPVRLFTRIILPLLRPGLITCFVLLFLVTWNDFIYPFFFLSKTAQWPITVGLYNFASGQQFTVRWNLVFAHVVLASLPAVIVFLIAQRRLIGGLMEGARKG